MAEFFPTKSILKKLYKNSFHKKPAPTNMVAGFRAIEEAVKSGKEFDKVLIQRGLKGPLFSEVMTLIKDYSIPFQYVPQEKLDGLTKVNHQGMIGFTAPIQFSDVESIVDEVFASGQSPKFIYLDGVTDVRNFGAICRTAECCGFHAVIVPEKGSAAINEDAVKTSAGALFHIPVCRVRSTRAFIEKLRNSGVKMMGCTEKSDKRIQDVDFSSPFCIIMGAEDTGISEEFMRHADELAKIEMLGKTSSLNVSVAAGMVMYELNRQRNP